MFFDFAESFGAPTEKIAPIYKKYLSDRTFCDDLWQKLFCGYEKGYRLPLYREAFVPSQFFSTANAFCTRENLDRDLFFLALYTALLEKSREIYSDYDIGENIFYDTAKLIFSYAEKNYKLTGNHGLRDYRRCAWYPALAAFRIGSLEYQAATNPYGAKAGLSERDIIIKIHVPESADITKAARESSYMSAYRFFSERLGMEKLSFTCESWLLSHEHNEILKGGNISSFASDFEIIEQYSDYDTGFLGHIFGNKDLSLPQKLPENNRLQKHYKNKLISGQPFYSATGIFEIGGDGIRKK